MSATDPDFTAAVAKLTLADQDGCGTSFSADQARALLEALPTKRQSTTPARWNVITIVALVFGWILLTAGTLGHDLHRLVGGSFLILLAWINVVAEGIIAAIRARADR